MIFLFGEKIKASVTLTGEFKCSICRSEQRFSDIQEKGYFTFMFVPTFPTSVHAEYRFCHQCENTFDIDFLTQPAYVSILQMILSYLINQYRTEQAKQQAIDLHERATGLEWDQEHLVLALSQIADWDALVKLIKRHKKSTDYSNRIKIISAVIEYMANIETIEYESRVQINMLASHLEIDPQYVSKVLHAFTKKT
jgi:hypothetical protein